ncbi:hypothetical protein MNBD_GAMMA20-73 [hydrothermal vent metagenome]|uniref:Uncharacterized protein n=1 Tax=hydrothermal vent metagenome TaxID=652676 RepID=A0A3B1ADQ9_9ZZZZ
MILLAAIRYSVKYGIGEGGIVRYAGNFTQLTENRHETLHGRGGVFSINKIILLHLKSATKNRHTEVTIGTFLIINHPKTQSRIR